MIAIFYRWAIRDGHERAFEQGWSRATRVYAAMGSLGSSLWRADNGDLCAFALWPDRAARAAAFASEEGAALLEGMAPHVDRVVEKVELDPVELAFKPGALA